MILCPCFVPVITRSVFNCAWHKFINNEESFKLDGDDMKYISHGSKSQKFMIVNKLTLEQV